MNAALIASDCLPRGGSLRIETSADAATPGFKIRATGQGARVAEELERALRGEPSEHDARSVQPVLTWRLAEGVNAGLTISANEGVVDLSAG
jgi:histidine phosphotransferase ChpT